MFKQNPVCEVCGKDTASAFVFIQNPVGSWKGSWKFACKCTTQQESYYVAIDKIFKSPPATVDWLAHLAEKDWVNWNDFMRMMHRFRQATKSFGQL